MHIETAIAITGIGVASPLGNGFAAMGTSLSQNQCGLRSLTRFDAGQYHCRIAGETPDEGLILPRQDLRHEYKRMDRFVQLAYSAGAEALAGAGLSEEKTENAFLALGVGMGGLPNMEAGVKQHLLQSPRQTSPYLIPSLIPNMAMSFMARALNWTGDMRTYASACVSGIVALGEAMEKIKSGRAKWALAGGVEAVITPITWSGFEAMRALSRSNQVVPFAEKRDGMAPGEAAVMMVLESVETALERGAGIYGLLYEPGYTTQPEAFVSPGDEALKNVFEKALVHAGTDRPAAVMAQASGMRVGDELEARALEALPGGREIPVCSIKGHMGHSFAASGPLNIAAAIHAMESGALPPILGLGQEAAVGQLNYQREAGSWEKGPVLVSGFGFGGIHAAIIVSPFYK